MKTPLILKLLAGVLTLVLAGWVVMHTRWVEVEVDNDPRGLAATDARYSLRHLLEGAGATLEVRNSMEPLPPPGATLLLESSLWNIFPERNARLKAWVENGGHLVLGRAVRGDDDLHWIPLSFVTPRPPKGAAKPAAAAASPADGDDQDDEDDKDAPPAHRKPDDQAHRERIVTPVFGAARPKGRCLDYEETDATPQPAYEPGRIYRACGYSGNLRALDNALVAAAVLQAAPGHAVWIIEDEKRDPLPGWLWHEARTPSLLALAAVALALWRLMVRFGPRQAMPPLARRSMGEQVRGTGQFIAGTDPRALHAATRQAFEDAARKRVEDWAALSDAERIAALAQAVAHSHAIAQPVLLQSLNIGTGATPAQVLAATAVLENARRMLLSTPATSS